MISGSSGLSGDAGGFLPNFANRLTNQMNHV